VKGNLEKTARIALARREQRCSGEAGRVPRKGATAYMETVEEKRKGKTAKEFSSLREGITKAKKDGAHETVSKEGHADQMPHRRNMESRTIFDDVTC